MMLSRCEKGGVTAPGAEHEHAILQKDVREKASSAARHTQLKIMAAGCARRIAHHIYMEG
jgi:hypothetical protein